MNRVAEVEGKRSWVRIWGRSTGLALLCLLALAAPAAAASSNFSLIATPAVAAKIAVTTTLAAVPSPAVTNQVVTLTATIHGYPTMSGGVEFDDSSGAIPGCVDQPITASGSDYTATCQTSFVAASSPEQLRATFTPASGSGLPSSKSSPVPLKIAKAATSTTVAPSIAAGGSGVTYTAVVTPGLGGPAEPAGAVVFLNAGTPIAGCTSQAVTAGASSSEATCTVSSPVVSYALSARYVGDANFIGSTSTAQNAVVVFATTDLPATLTATSAVLNGYVYTGGQAVSWQFQYGRSTAYGLDTPAQTIGAGQGTMRVSWPVAALSSGALYHYRLVVTAVTGAAASPVISQAEDVTFETPIGGRLLLTARTLSVIGRSVFVSQRCSSPRRCDGRFTITTPVRRGKAASHGRVVLCTVSRFRIRAHKRKTVSSRLKRRCLAMLRNAPHHRLSAKLTSQTATGGLRATRKVTLILR